MKFELWEGVADTATLGLCSPEISKGASIHYARGTKVTDNHPKLCTAKDFNAFESTVLADRSPKKGMTYICSTLKLNGDARPHRCKADALGRRFLVFDIDGMRGGTVFAELCLYLSQTYRGFMYTTSSYTPENPRARIILEANREMTYWEVIRVSLSIQADLIKRFGIDAFPHKLNGSKSSFDESVYRGETEIFTPLTNAITAQWIDGESVDVDEVLKLAPPESEVNRKNEEYREWTHEDALEDQIHIRHNLANVHPQEEPELWRVLLIIQRAFGYEEGLKVIEGWDSGSHSNGRSFTWDEVMKIWNDVKKSRNPYSDITIGTFLEYAKRGKGVTVEENIQAPRDKWEASGEEQTPKAEAKAKKETYSNYLTTDLSNAERIVREFGGDLIVSAGQWYVWNGAYWEVNEPTAREKSFNLSRIILDEARDWEKKARESGSEDEKKIYKAIAKDLRTWAKKSEMSRAFDAALKITKDLVASVIG